MTQLALFSQTPSGARVIQAILALVMGNFILTFGDVAIKLMGAKTGIFQYLAIRHVMAVVLVWPFWRRLAPEQRAPSGFKIHVLRGNLSFLGALCAFYALMHLTLATANVIFYAAPIVTLFLARVWLKLSLNAMQILQVMIGFIGVNVALRPDQLHWAALSALMVALTMASCNLLSCRLPKNQTMASMVFWSHLSAWPVSLALAIYFWQPFQLEALLLASVLALTTMLYQVIATKAYRSTSAAEIAVSEYSGLLFALLIGLFYFKEPADWYTLTGMVLIVFPLLWQSIYVHQRRLKVSSNEG